MKSYLVTGCAGFIGSHVCEKLLRQGNKVLGIDNFDDYYDLSIKKRNLNSFAAHPDFSFYEMDITDSASWNNIDKKVDVVIHLAAKVGIRPSIDDAYGYLQTNVYGTQNLLDWMVKNQLKKIVFASSSSVYGNNKKIPFHEEDSVDFPISPYAYTKKSCELMLYTYHHLCNMNAICLRFFTVYGPRQRPDLAIHKFVKQIFNNEYINLYGDGTTGRDYTYVEDIVDGVLKSIDFVKSRTETFEIINLGNNNPVLLKDLLFLLEKTIGKKSLINNMPMQAGDVNYTFADISKAKKLLNYSPNTTLEVGLKKFVDWYQSEG
jgi:UDP-glucuronate 4-epimerase